MNQKYDIPDIYKIFEVKYIIIYLIPELCTLISIKLNIDNYMLSGCGQWYVMLKMINKMLVSKSYFVYSFV